MNRKKINHKKMFLAFGFLVIFFFSFWFFSSVNEKKPEAENISDRISVSLVKVSDLKLNGAQISVNGQVESINQATLSSEVGGILQAVNVSIGQNVSKGQLLASFDTSDAKLSLVEAEAGLTSQKARLVEMKSGRLDGEMRKLESAVESAKISLERTIQETEDAINSTRKSLLNNDLQAYLADEGILLGDYYNMEPPRISGTYNGEEGEYKITLYRSMTQSGYSFRYQGPEGRGFGSVNTVIPQSLGNNGLYIIFPENFARGYNIEWVIPIPNERGVGYLSVKNAYQKAKDSQDSTIRQAEENLKQRKEDLELARSGSREEQIEAQEAQVLQATARVEAVRSQLNKRQIRAPFSGTISRVFVRVGENVIPGQQMFSLANEQLLKINAQVSPAQARMISTGDSVLVAGKHNGVVQAISRALDSQTGQVQIQITVEDLENNLFVGEYVTSNIFTNTGSDSVLLPLSSVDVSSVGNAVFVVEEDRAKRVPVSLGSIEGNMINIIEGLEDIEFIIKNASLVRSGQLVEVIE